jgi:hypothetical protein
MSALMQILKQRHRPELYAKEQAALELKHQQHLAFVEGAKAVIESEKIGKALFISDSSSPSGFKPNNK